MQFSEFKEIDLITGTSIESIEEDINNALNCSNKVALLKDISDYVKNKVWEDGFPYGMGKLLDKVLIQYRPVFQTVFDNTLKCIKSDCGETKENIFIMITALPYEELKRASEKSSKFIYSKELRICLVIIDNFEYGIYSFEKEKFIEIYERP